ncbi:Ku protein [Conexibacter woesei]|uniref:non-homologous end joining protein Ku n=1 Tax=Conexibacter woesei TaxID=191495 RepID=UPI00041CEDB6|nr:Ku protein [Conexibacter woesei]
MAPRSLWNGTIAFGAVAVPIKLYSAVAPRTVHFHEVHLKDGARIEHRPFCTKEDREVAKDEVVKGFEVREGRYVVVDQEEIDAAGGSRSRIIDVEHFVDAAAIDPVYFDKAYFLGARDEGGDAYRLLHDALEQTGRAAIGRFTFHHREYLVAIKAYEKVLALHTMRFADELVTRRDLDAPRLAGRPEAREVRMAEQLVAALTEDFRPGRLHDEYRETVLAAIRDKARGRDIDIPEAEPEEERDDLAAALEASLPRRRGRTRAKATKKKAAA